VVRVSGYRSRGPGFYSWRFQICYSFTEAVDISDYAAPDDWTNEGQITWKRCKRNQAWPNLRYLPLIPGRTEEKHDNLHSVSRQIFERVTFTIHIRIVIA
jgi:hypothetical protein